MGGMEDEKAVEELRNNMNRLIEQENKLDKIIEALQEAKRIVSVNGRSDSASLGAENAYKRKFEDVYKTLEESELKKHEKRRQFEKAVWVPLQFDLPGSYTRRR